MELNNLVETDGIQMTTTVLERTIRLLTTNNGVWETNNRLRVLRDVFALFESLQNERNITTLANALLHSKLWTRPYELIHEIVGSNRYLSSGKAYAISTAIIKARGDPWKKTILLTACIDAEVRDGVPWLEQYGSSYVYSLNASMTEVTCDMNRKAALLISLSYVYTTLSKWQLRKINKTIPSMIEGLYLSELVYSGDVERNRGFRELGLLSRTIVECISDGNVNASLEIVLQRASSINYSELVNKQSFLSITSITQALLTSATSFDPILSLDILRKLQHIDVEHTAFESWRFIFNYSLDHLIELPEYIDQLISNSSLSRNPLLGRTGLYSAKQDADDVHWLLMILEASAGTVKSKSTLTRIYNYCDSLVRQPPSTKTKDPTEKDMIELSHSVLHSLHKTHFKLFQQRVESYTRLVLSPLSAGLSDRQFRLIITSLYRLSLRPSTTEEEPEDPFNLLSTLALSIKNTPDSSIRDRMILEYIDCLPRVPARELHSHLGIASRFIKDAEKPELDARLIEVCTTEMTPDRAIICVKFLLRRDEIRAVL